MSITVTSDAFADNAPIPTRHTGDGEDISPPLSWTGVPDAAASVAVICDDPDAPTNEPWVHWLIWNIPPKRHGLPEGLPRHDELTGTVTARQGANSFASDNVGYRGPAPPPGHGTHHYHFKVYALDTTLDLPAGSDRDRLMAAMEGHVLADGELVATYER